MKHDWVDLPKVLTGQMESKQCRRCGLNFNVYADQTDIEVVFEPDDVDREECGVSAEDVVEE